MNPIDLGKAIAEYGTPIITAMVMISLLASKTHGKRTNGR